MFRNYLKTAFRNLWRHKRYTFINVLGLAIGLTCCISLARYIYGELNYDTFHSDAEWIYRIHRQYQEVQPSAAMEYPVARVVADAAPEAEGVTRILDYWFDPVLSTENEGFYESNMLYVDDGFFDVFDFPLAMGNPEQAFAGPRTILLSRESARKYFGDENPIGKTLTYNADLDFTVTGVFGELPSNSHFTFDGLIYARDLGAIMDVPDLEENWDLGTFITYFRFTPGTDITAIASRITPLLQRQEGTSMDYWFFPMLDIHLHSDVSGELAANSDIRFIWLLVGIGLIILLLACVNYMNLTTSLFTRRLREAGVRQVVGAGRSQLFWQFIAESLLLTTIAFGLALILVEVSLPILRQLTGSVLRSSLEVTLLLSGAAFLAALITGFISGLYPALFIVRQRMAALLKAQELQAGRTVLWKWLVVVQFVLAVVLIVNTVMIYQQLQFMQEKKLGFREEHLITIPVRDKTLQDKPGFLKEQLGGVPGVVEVASSVTLPSLPTPGTTIAPSENSGLEAFRSYLYFVDDHFLPTMGIRLLAGRNLRPTDQDPTILVNESMLEAIGLVGANASVGKTIRFWGQEYEIAGVVENFHYESVRKEIEPLVMLPDFERSQGLVIRLRGDDLETNLANLKRGWEAVSKVQPFTFNFVDEEFGKNYEAERRLSHIMWGAAVLAIFIACLGLLGLAAFAAERRTKEIGIRKALGASTSNILLLFNREFMMLVGVATLIALPLAWLALQRWLDTFAYQVAISPWLFFGAACSALVLAAVTVCLQSLRTAQSNPVDALRYE